MAGARRPTEAQIAANPSKTAVVPAGRVVDARCVTYVLDLAPPPTRVRGRNIRSAAADLGVADDDLEAAFSDAALRQVADGVQALIDAARDGDATALDRLASDPAAALADVAPEAATVLRAQRRALEAALRPPPATSTKRGVDRRPGGRVARSVRQADLDREVVDAQAALLEKVAAAPADRRALARSPRATVDRLLPDVPAGIRSRVVARIDQVREG
jgi:hypothetical protein